MNGEIFNKMMQDYLIPDNFFFFNMEILRFEIVPFFKLAHACQLWFLFGWVLPWCYSIVLVCPWKLPISPSYPSTLNYVIICFH